MKFSEDSSSIKNGNLVNVTIDSLAFGGEGVGRINSGGKPLVVFAEDTVPGDKVELEISVKKRNFARGHLRKIISPSPDRILPRWISANSAPSRNSRSAML